MALVLLTLVSPAAAPASSEDPAVEQYVERVPSADGDPASGPRARRSELPARIERRVEREGGEDAAALEALAESPVLGAPSVDGDRTRGGRAPATRAESAAAAERPSALRAVGGAPAHGDGGTVGLLLAGLALVTIAVGAAAVRGRRAD